MILDTTSLIWVLRGHPRAIALVDRLPLAERNLSSVTYLEILRGCRDKTDLERTRRLLEDEFGEVVPLDEEVTRVVVRLMERYALSRRPGIPDLFIAATALARGETLATENVKDFDYISGLHLKPFVP